MAYDRRTHAEGAFWRNLSSLAPHLDTRDYKPSHPFFVYNEDKADYLKYWQRRNHGRIGVLRDEAGGDRIIKEVVALKAKSYSVLFHNLETGEESEKVRCKGIPKNVAANGSMGVREYRQCLTSGLSSTVNYCQLRYKLHEIYLSSLTKQSLSSWNSKVFQLNLVHSLPYGHKDIAMYLQQYADEQVLADMASLIECEEEEQDAGDEAAVIAPFSSSSKITVTLEDLL